MRKIMIAIASITAFGFIAGIIGLTGLYYWASKDLPSFTGVADYRPALVTTVVARDGQIMGQLYREKRYLINLDQMTKYLPLAFLAIEDTEFYEHEGVNPTAILRAFIVNLQAGTTKQGGSTITQQLIKRLLLTPERSYIRKLKEAILAYRLENYLSKDEILTIYLNHIFLGSNSYGVEAAARTYFGKQAKDLTIAECAVIAGLPQAPSRYSPYRDRDVAKNRQMQVLRRMHEVKWITDAEFEEASNQPLIYQRMKEGLGDDVDWYLEEVRRNTIDLLEEKNAKSLGIELPVYGEEAIYTLGLTIYTAMSPQHQMAADKALRKGLEQATKRHGWRGPLQNIAENIDEYAKTMHFTPQSLMNGAWTKAIVTEVQKDSAKVKMGNYHGTLFTKTMTWARIPNPKIAAAYAPSIKDANKILKVGDLIWVSAVSDEKNPYEADKITAETDIILKLEQVPDVQGALVSIEPQTGDVVALVGGYSFSDSKFNRATQAKRQPGSSFKPIVYSAALDNGFTGATTVLDAPVVQLAEQVDLLWRPKNYSGGFEGPILLRTALAKSKNLCTIRIAQEIGMPKVLERANILGLGYEDLDPFLSLSLGAGVVSPMNMTKAYTAFAHNGMLSDARLIVRITDRFGNILYDNQPKHNEVISPENAYIMASLMKEVVTSGTATKAKVLNRPVAGKTGTSNDEQDAWFIGYTPYLVSGVWVGYDQLKPLGKLETGGAAALPIFVDYGKQVFDSYPADDFIPPENIITAKVDAKSGLLVGASEQGFVIPFTKGTEPKRYAASSANAEKSGEDLLKQLF